MSHKGKITIRGKMLQQISFDPEFGCLYLRFSQEEVCRTHEHSDYINIDFDKKGEIIGIEFLFVKAAAGNLNKCFIELSKTYNRPELKAIPKELNRVKKALDSVLSSH